ncbi:MAG: hypothetical protein CSA38_00160 [Flavobacteriales bacterium]|nr:MAG: hypothetical protein CSA38_00160 [Flavobacteriales bacterium]
MKKIILSFAVASLVLSCQKPTKGGNHGVLKLEDGVERYDTHERRYEGDHQSAHHAGGHGHHGDAHGKGHGDHAHGDDHAHGNDHAHAHHAEQVNLDLNGVALHANKGGLEESLIGFLHSGKYAKATNEELKKNWYNFDNVKFKMGSSNQLEKGSQEQLDNLAKILKAYPDAKIKIGGYTDKTGNEEANKKLSTKRAEFIKAELGKMGVGAQVISAEGYGSEFATVSADASDEERAKDRKMAVRFTK